MPENGLMAYDSMQRQSIPSAVTKDSAHANITRNSNSDDNNRNRYKVMNQGHEILLNKSTYINNNLEVKRDDKNLKSFPEKSRQKEIMKANDTTLLSSSSSNIPTNKFIALTLEEEDDADHHDNSNDNIVPVDAKNVRNDNINVKEYIYAEWACQVCTFINNPPTYEQIAFGELVCEMCTTPAAFT